MTEPAIAEAAGETTVAPTRSLVSDAWRDLRRKPIFWASSIIIAILVLMAVFPRLFTRADPYACQLRNSLLSPSGDHWFGTNLQGCDIYARVVYGARASLEVGFLSVVGVAIIAILLGMAAGYYGGWSDALIARVTDIVLGIPLLLGAIVILSSVDLPSVWPVVLALALLGWTTATRIVRSSVIAAKQQDYVQAARMLGANNRRIMGRHIAPNAMAPVIVILTITLGQFIAVEATLSFLGIGVKGNTITWGKDIAAATARVTTSLGPVLFPSTFLALTVLAFIMLGDAVREAFDPKLR
ncbi:peptide/nickel transport system permease protein/oligopeptide transport system permease protein [Stackebrandtia endophytica]|uniref:Peptide/nickel transport system permease protein/oligopeptide transport system permease protein n=1 Tax=Stackebrandtia endophytica TaxID=1496996 RepID=A0A543AV30_9ACTN|nr:ABC transporter permease [Stackebrandtia endophytica]TQL76435.1 peptide/nickel transport system permease protein/oligopeptide transport system permease protein [Stackebrandtia endophytica]